MIRMSVNHFKDLILNRLVNLDMVKGNLSYLVYC